jgi:hypothetical protein
MRRKGAEALAETDDPAAVVALVEALEDRSRKVRRSVGESLKTLNGSAIDEFCKIWATERNGKLKGIILEQGYIATGPLDVHALTSFLNCKKPQISISEETLKACLTDKEKKIVKQAVSYIAESKGEVNKVWLPQFLFEQLDN